MADIYNVIPHFLAYNGLKRSNSVRIRFNQAEESKYEILIPFEYKQFNTAAIWWEIAHNLMFMRNIKYNGIKHCYRADVYFNTQ